MSGDFDGTLAGVINHAAGAAQPQGPAAARAKGRKRTMRKRIILSSASFVLVAGGAIGAAFAVGGDRGAPTVTASGPHPAPTARLSSVQPSAPAAASSSAPSAGASTVTPTLSLDLPASFAAGTTNDFGFTVDNPGPARSVVVTLDLGTPTTVAPSAHNPNEQAVLDRQVSAGGSWSPVPVTFFTSASGSLVDTATYRFDLPARARTTENLRLIPVGSVPSDTEIGVTLSGGGIPALAQSKAVPLITLTMTVAGPSVVAAGSTQMFDFTLANTTLADYPAFLLYLYPYAIPTTCDPALFTTAQWSDGGAMRTVALPAKNWLLLGTISLASGQSQQIIVELRVPATLASCVNRGQVALVAMTGDISSIHDGDFSTTAIPNFAVTGDSSIFTIS